MARRIPGLPWWWNWWEPAWERDVALSTGWRLPTYLIAIGVGALMLWGIFEAEQAYTIREVMEQYEEQR